VVRKLPTYVDLIPLSPSIYANLYALLHPAGAGYDMPASIHAEQRAKAANRLEVLAEEYGRYDGRIDKLPFPCLYMEDDLDIIGQALHRARLYLLHRQGLCFHTSRGLVASLSAMHPGSRDFLARLLATYEALKGAGPDDDAATNLYACLHRFMTGLLSGDETVSVEGLERRLGISVGIITRNRAPDLREAMASLLRQTRPADEVIVVDNGSSDNTRQVVEDFAGILPIRYVYLEEASIPAARNRVVENARYEVIAFTDDDCITEPRWLASVERGFLRAENIGIVGGWVKHAGAPRDTLIDRYYRVFHHNTT